MLAFELDRHIYIFILQTKLAVRIKRTLQRIWGCQKRPAGSSGLPVESVLEALPLACSSALICCMSVDEGATLGLVVSSEWVVQLLSDVKGHLRKESKEGHVQQGMVNVRAKNRRKSKTIQCNKLHLAYM